MGDIICICHLRWDFVWQRPQHLISRLARHHRVLFVEEPLPAQWGTEARLEIRSEYWKSLPSVNVARLLQPGLEPGAWGHGYPQTQQTYADLLAEYVEKERYTNTLLWLYTPMASGFAQRIPHDLLIYDVMDQLSAFKDAPREIKEREKALLQNADVVFTGGVSLYRDKAPHNVNTHLFPSGVEIEHYATARQRLPAPPDLASIASPILGYFGVIDERIDVDLIASIAQQRPDWQIVMIGPVVKIDPAMLPQAANIHYLGMKDYRELPAYLANFDVALTPFALCEATRYLSPTKTLEYMAAHKPIVSTPLHDVVELYGEAVRIADCAETFIAQIEAALNEGAAERASRRAVETKLLDHNTWDNVTRRMREIITTTQVSRRVSPNGNGHASFLKSRQPAKT